MTRIQILTAALQRDFGVTVTLSKYSPGDGWSRYGVSVDKWHDIREGMSRAECEVYLQGAYDMLQVQRDRTRN